MQPRYLQDLIRSLQEFYKCPSCETSYHFADIRVLGEMENFCFMQLSCHSCSMPVLATVTINDQASEVRPGLSHQSPAGHSVDPRYATRGPITAGEIAEFHHWITKSRLVFKKRK